MVVKIKLEGGCPFEALLSRVTIFTVVKFRSKCYTIRSNHVCNFTKNIQMSSRSAGRLVVDSDLIFLLLVIIWHERCN